MLCGVDTRHPEEGNNYQIDRCGGQSSMCCQKWKENIQLNFTVKVSAVVSESSFLSVLSISLFFQATAVRRSSRWQTFPAYEVERDDNF